MADLIDRKNLQRDIMDYLTLEDWQCVLVNTIVYKQMVIDAVPVVRCKDCVHRDPEDKKCDCGSLERQGCPFPVDDNYFCGYGERKEGENDVCSDHLPV